jgi:hypothetical protein
MKIALTSLGLDLFPKAFGKWTEEESPKETIKAIEEKIGDLDKKKFDDAFAYSVELLNRENDRGGTIESKAQNLIGVTGITTGFITGIASLLPEKINHLVEWQGIVILLLYILIALSLTMTILLAFRVIKVGKYKTIILDIEDVFKMQSISYEDIRKERLASIIYAYNRNQRTYDKKASYLIGSQIWFRNAIILFLLLAIASAILLPFAKTDNSSFTEATPPPPVNLTSLTPMAYSATSNPIAKTPTCTKQVSSPTIAVTKSPVGTPTTDNSVTPTYIQPSK